MKRLAAGLTIAAAFALPLVPAAPAGALDQWCVSARVGPLSPVGTVEQTVCVPAP